MELLLLKKKTQDKPTATARVLGLETTIRLSLLVSQCTNASRAECIRTTTVRRILQNLGHRGYTVTKLASAKSATLAFITSAKSSSPIEISTLLALAVIES